MNRRDYQTIIDAAQGAAMVAQILQNLEYVRSVDPEYDKNFDEMCRAELGKLSNNTLMALYRLNNEIKQRRVAKCEDRQQ